MFMITDLFYVECLFAGAEFDLSSLTDVAVWCVVLQTRALGTVLDFVETGDFV